MNDIAPNTAVAERQAKPLDLVRGALERMRPQLEMALPKHLTADRLLRVAMTAVQTTPKLLDCDRTSLYRAIMMCAQLGLEPDGVLGQAYLIPFGKNVQFIPGYKGLLSLARNSGDVSSIAAHEVRENDTFEFDFASGDPPRHTFDIRKADDRGEVIAFYAVARFKDGAFHWDMMTRTEVDRIRDGSQGYQTAKRYSRTDSPWMEHYVEMGKKTVIRRIAKYLPMSVQRAAAIADAYDTGKHVTMDKYGEVVIEGDAATIDESTPRIESRQSNLDRFEEQHAGPETAAQSEAAADDATQADTPHDPQTGEIAPEPNAATPQPDLLGAPDRSPLFVPLPRIRAPKSYWQHYARQVEHVLTEGHPAADIAKVNADGITSLRTMAPEEYRVLTTALGVA